MQLVLPRIIEREGELTPQVFGEIQSVFPVQSDRDFRIGFRKETVAFRHQCRAVALEIVELPVGCQDIPAVHRTQWLATAFRVVDREACMPEGEALFRIDVRSLVVRTTVLDLLKHVSEMDGCVFRDR